MSPFDFGVVSKITTKIIQPVFMTMSDGASLATYSVIPKVGMKALLLFFHGAGFYSGPLYQEFANELVGHEIGVVLVDVRGHGKSSGPRGDAPSKERVWDDILEVLKNLQQTYPLMPIFLGGHSSGSGLILNYNNYKNDRFVAGYLMLAPYWGHSSNTNKECTKPYSSFVKKVKLWAIFGNIFSGGLLFSHTKALFFDYPEEIQKREPLIVDSYACAMVSAITPNNAKQCLERLDKPLAVFIGEDDEQFDSQKILAFAQNCRNLKMSKSLPKAKHLNILEKSVKLTASFILNNL